MGLPPESKEQLTLQELSKRTKIEPRTIRNYIERQLLPPSYGQGMRAGYGEKHLDHLNFILEVRRKANLSLDDIRNLIHSLPEEQVRRVARGEEEVRAIPVWNMKVDEDQELTHPQMQDKPYFSGRRERQPRESRTNHPNTWMAAEIAKGLELRQYGHDPKDRKRMERLASLLMSWLEEEREREASQ